MKPKVCFLGGTRYSQPLNATQEKKWRLLSEVGEMFVIGFSQDLWPRCFTQHARFHLFPRLPLAPVRRILMLLTGYFILLGLILTKGIQILVAQSPYEGFAAALAKRTARLLGRRVALIVESHGDFEKGFFLQHQVFLPTLYRSVMRRMACFALHHADLLRAISGSTRNQLERWAPGKTIVQFPTWTDLDVFLNTVSPVPRPDDIIYAGVLTPLKGVHHLLNAFAMLPKDLSEARLLIIGHPEDREYTANLKAQVKRLGLDGRVEFLGEVSQKELASYMAQSRVFVLPSLSEGLGRVVFEAMAVGTPVVASRVGGIPEVVEEGVTGFLIPPGDEVSLEQKLRWILQHPSEVAEMGHRARVFAQQFFSTSMYVQNYDKLFRETMKKVQD